MIFSLRCLLFVDVGDGVMFGTLRYVAARSSTYVLGRYLRTMSRTNSERESLILVAECFGDMR